MTKFHIEWKQSSKIPEDPVKLAKLYLSHMELVKADLKSGKLTDFGQYSNGSSGYALVEGTEIDVFTTLMKWLPYVEFDVKPIVNVDKTIEAINKLLAQSKTV
jgi:hypothetical protein